MSIKEKTPEGERVDAYLNTVGRMEPDITMVDHDAAMPSIAISLRRIADTLERIDATLANWRSS